MYCTVVHVSSSHTLTLGVTNCSCKILAADPPPEPARAQVSALRAARELLAFSKRTGNSCPEQPQLEQLALRWMTLPEADVHNPAIDSEFVAELGQARDFAGMHSGQLAASVLTEAASINDASNGAEVPPLLCGTL